MDNSESPPRLETLAAIAREGLGLNRNADVVVEEVTENTKASPDSNRPSGPCLRLTCPIPPRVAGRRSYPRS